MLESTLHPEICGSCLVLFHVISSELFAIQASDSIAVHVSYIFLHGLLKHGGSSVLDHLHNLTNSFIHAIFMNVLVKPVDFLSLLTAAFM